VAYRTVDQRMWGDENFQALSAPEPNAQSLWIFLLIGPLTTSLPGLIRIGEAGLAESLGWSLKPFRERFQELLLRGMIKADWQARVLWIPNAIKYNMPANPNVIKGWKSHWDLIPECSLKSEAHKALMAAVSEKKPFAEAFIFACGNGLPNRLANGMANQGQGQDQRQDQDQEQEQDQGQQVPASPVVATSRPDGAIEELRERWNATPGVVPWKASSSKRTAAFRLRIKDQFWVDNVQAALERLSASTFCTGGGDRGWRADIDWFMRADTVMKLIEGKYDNRNGKGSLFSGPAQFAAEGDER
jgi:hypothetical protein